MIKLIASYDCAVCGTFSRAQSLPTLQQITITGPIRWIHALFHQVMKRRIRPFGHGFHQTMLDRVDMHIIHMCIEISFVTDQVFPEAPLPNGAFASFLPRGIAPLRLGYSMREPRLDQTPAQREIRVAFRQFDHAMQMIRQYNPTMDTQPWIVKG